MAKTLDKQRIYVVDTNVLVDYPDIVPTPDGEKMELDEPTVDLSGAHIVVPTAVIRELSSFKKEKSERGKAARLILRRLRELVEDEDVYNMDDVYRLSASVLLSEKANQRLSILPVHKNFKKCLPYSPSEGDMDGQIILATLTVIFLRKGWPIDGTAERCKLALAQDEGVTLLTNDNGLAIRARERGIRTERYGYEYPEPYTGRRNVVVPKEVFYEFYNTQKLTLDYWHKMMPSQPELIANEFIVMSLANESDYPRDFSRYDGYFSHIGRYDAEEEKIVTLQYAKQFPVKLKNDGQAIYAEVLMDPRIAAVICTGPAGSGKTYMATVYGYTSCKTGQYIGVTVVPCATEGKLGALPGDLDEKMDPSVRPLKNALRNYLLNEDSKLRKELSDLKEHGIGDKSSKSMNNGKCNGNKKKGNSKGCGSPDDYDNNEKGANKRSIKEKLEDRVNLIWDKNFESVPIEHARGRDFSHEMAIYDEFQDQTVKQADTLIKRIGTNGKIIITGDIEQIHAIYIDRASSGLAYASQQLLDDPMVAQVHFIEEEVIRHPLVKMIAERQKAKKKRV